MLSLRDSLELRLGGRYAIEGEIGSGAASHVYLANPADGSERIVIKVLRPRMSGSRNVDQETVEEHFLLEMRILQTLKHPRVVSIIEAGEAGGRLFFTMPFIPGSTLRHRLTSSGPLPVRDALRVARDIADALGHVHSSGVIHQDVKPDNIMLGIDGAYLLDFGLALAPAMGYEPQGGDGVRNVVGTPEYMSPEQLTGNETLDRRSDVFSLGCVLYEMLSGRPPYSSRKIGAARIERERDGTPDLRNSAQNVPEDVEKIVRRAMNERPVERFQSAPAMQRAIEEALETELQRAT